MVGAVDDFTFSNGALHTRQLLHFVQYQYVGRCFSSRNEARRKIASFNSSTVGLLLLLFQFSALCLLHPVLIRVALHVAENRSRHFFCRSLRFVELSSWKRSLERSGRGQGSFPD